jgi:hypothetical protein
LKNLAAAIEPLPGPLQAISAELGQQIRHTHVDPYSELASFDRKMAAIDRLLSQSCDILFWRAHVAAGRCRCGGSPDSHPRFQPAKTHLA